MSLNRRKSGIIGFLWDNQIGFFILINIVFAAIYFSVGQSETGRWTAAGVTVALVLLRVYLVIRELKKK